MAVKGHLENIDELSDERGTARRKLLLETSGALPGGEQANVILHNLSPTGMLLETTLQLSEGEYLEVDLPEAGGVTAEVIWASGILFGCRFSNPLATGAFSATQLRASAPLPPEIGRPATARRATGEMFGKRLEKLRKQRGMTLADVADRLGVSKPTVWAWEKGKARPVEDRLPALANALGVKQDELASYNEPPGIAELMQSSRERIADAYGTTPERVRIMIEL